MPNSTINNGVDKSVARSRPVGDELFGGRLKGTYYLELTISDIKIYNDHICAITFVSPDLVGFSHEPAQDIMMEFPLDQRTTRRRYTIRRSDPINGTLDVEIELHANGIASTWTRKAKTGDVINAIGPRGVLGLEQNAPTYLFVADDSGIPAVAARIEALGPDAKISTLVVSKSGENSRPFPKHDSMNIYWTTEDNLSSEIEKIELTADTAVYIFGERSLVNAAVDVVISKGVYKEKIRSKAYWRKDKANADHGEPDK